MTQADASTADARRKRSTPALASTRLSRWISTVARGAPAPQPIPPRRVSPESPPLPESPLPAVLHGAVEQPPGQRASHPHRRRHAAGRPRPSRPLPEVRRGPARLARRWSVCALLAVRRRRLPDRQGHVAASGLRPGRRAEQTRAVDQAIRFSAPVAGARRYSAVGGAAAAVVSGPRTRSRACRATFPGTTRGWCVSSPSSRSPAASRVTSPPETPGAIHEGGELGYAISHAYGAAFDDDRARDACGLRSMSFSCSECAVVSRLNE